MVFNWISSLVQRFIGIPYSLSAWLNRHKRGIAILILFFGLAWTMWRIIRWKFMDFFLGFIDKPTKTLLDKNTKLQLKQFFDQAQKTSVSQALNHVNQVGKQLADLVPDPDSSTLRSSLKASQEEKVRIWEETKVQTFVKLFSAIYGLASALMLFKVVINLTARYTYVEKMDEDPKALVTPELGSEVKRAYDSIVKYLLSKEGQQQIVSHIEKLIESDLQTKTVATMCSRDDSCFFLVELDRKLRRSITVDLLIQWMMPPSLDELAKAQPTLLELLNETRDVIHTNQFLTNFNLILNSNCDLVLKDVAAAYADPQKSQNGSIAIARLLPILKRSTKTLLTSEDTPDSFVKGLLLHQPMDEFSYFVFSSAYNNP